MDNLMDHCGDDVATSALPKKYGDGDVAVVGMAINIAGASDVEEFWNSILQGEPQHIEVPPERLTLDKTNGGRFERTRGLYGNFIQHHDTFDDEFFHKSPTEPRHADPRQRLFLHCAYQAVEQSGYCSAKEQDKRVAVYVGVDSTECEANFDRDKTSALPTGHLKSVIAAQVSHNFEWTGPCLAIDTACSSAAMAVHLGCRAILSGECTAALVGGTQMSTSSFPLHDLAAAPLNPTRPCRLFDAMADCRGRGEGAGAVFLKKMSKARQDGDMIIASIASTAVLQNENSTAMFVPNADSLANLMRSVVCNAGIVASDVTMVEAHGAGARIVDAAEWESIRRVLGGSCSRSKPLPVCSIKSLVGHTGCASGIVSLIKILAMLHKELIPLQSQSHTLFPAIRTSSSDMLEIPIHHRQWDQHFRAALINSLGATGSNSAMVVTKIQQEQRGSFDVCGKQPFLITANDAESLCAYAHRLAQYIRANEASVADISFHLSRQSNRLLPHRLSFYAETRASLLEKLDARSTVSTALGSTRSRPSRPAILCFGGQKSKAIALSRETLDAFPLLRRFLDQCDSILVSKGLSSIYPEIFQVNDIENTVKLQIALFSLQYACAKTWQACGLEIAAIVGYSLGELTCLAVSGVLSLEDTITMIHARAALMQNDFGPDPGAMLVIEEKHERVSQLLDLFDKEHSRGILTIACYNGPTSFTIAGSTAAINALEAHLRQCTALRWNYLSVGHACHSPLVDPLMAKMGLLAEGMSFRKPQIRWERTTREASGTSITAAYLASHAREPVFAYDAFQRLQDEIPEAVWLEAGSNSSITRIVEEALNAPNGSLFQGVTITGDLCSPHSLAETTASLWQAGVSVTHWPHHPFQRRAYQELLLPPYQFKKTRQLFGSEVPHKVVLPHYATGSTNTKSNLSAGLFTSTRHRDQRTRTLPFQINTALKDYQDIRSVHAPTKLGASKSRVPTTSDSGDAHRNSRIPATVCQVVAAVTGVQADSLTFESELADLGIDSLTRVELASNLHRHFACGLATAQEWSKIFTVADLVRCVEASLRGDR